MNRTLLAVCLLGAASAVACSNKDSSSGSSAGTGGASPGISAKFRTTLANPAPAELKEGERLYYEETFGTETLDEWPPADFMVKLWKSDPDTWGEQFSKYGWLVDPGDDLPVGLKRGTVDRKKVHETCATCHVAKLSDGRIWSGMPATELDWARFRLDVDAAWVAAGHASLVSPADAKKNQAIQQVGSLDSSSSDDPRFIPTDFPLYVNLGARKNLGYTGAGHDARSQIYLSIFTFGAGDTLPFPPKDLANALVAYMSWATPPTPTSFDATAAGRGKKVFDTAGCGSCHHVDDLSKDGVAEVVAKGPELMPGADPAHPEGTIATDSSFYGLSDGSVDGGGPGPGLEKLIMFVLTNGLNVGQTDGYAVTDLHGLFTSAPYLHNGSIPSLDVLLMPAADRPKTFQRGGRTVDTTKQGTSNAGHEFGTTLSASDKQDLIAYLLSL